MSIFQKLKLLGKGSSYELTNTLLAEVAAGNLDSVIKLVTDARINKKISYRFRDDNGDCVLHVAVRNNHQDIARIMLELAPDTASRKNKKTGETPLHMAVYNRAVDLIRVLINYHAKMEVFYNGMTPLMQAADSGHTECISALLQYGASKLTVDRHGRKAYDYAKTSEDKELLRASKRETDNADTSRNGNQQEYLIASSRSEEYDEDTRERLPVQDQYKLGPRIGEGAYAASYIAKNVRYHFECVLKALAANNLDDINDSLAEGLTLALFKDCRRVIRFNDFFISLPDNMKDQAFNMAVRTLTTTKRIKPGSRQGNCVVNLAMEWAKGGDVFTLVSNRLLQAAEEEERLEREMYERQMEDASFEAKDPIYVEPIPFTEDEICRLVGQICEALVDIHSCHFIHRDIKPGNLFMDENENVMLGDFGIAKFFEEGYKNSAPAHTVVGSQNYMASEMHDTSKPYTRAVDIFAVGCVIYFLVKFNHPNFFMKDARSQVLPEMKDACSDFIFHLTERMWDPVPDLRPSAKEVLEWIERRQVGPRRQMDPGLMKKDAPVMTPEMEENLKKQKKVPLRRRYAVGKLISSGNHMYKARHIYTRKKYVMKRMPCDSLTEVNERLQEAAHLAHLRRSKHVVWFQDMFLDLTLRRELDPSLDTKNNETCDDRLSVCIVMQYCAGGDLGEYLQQYINERGDGAYLPEDRVLRWIVNAACGLRDIHNANVIHRNIGMENLFLTKELELLLGEFGSAKDVRTFGDARTLFQGASEFQAPELQAMNSDQGSYTAAVDIFSLGVVLYQLLTLQPPSFGGMPEIPPHYTQFVRDLAARMVSPNPNDRPSAVQLVKLIETDLKRDPRRGQQDGMLNGGGLQQRRSNANSVSNQRMTSPQVSPGYGGQYGQQGGRGGGVGIRGGRGGGRLSGAGGPGGGQQGGYGAPRGGRRPPGGVAMAGMPRQGTGGGMPPDQASSYDNRGRNNSAPRGGYGPRPGGPGGPQRGMPQGGMQRGGGRTPRAPSRPGRPGGGSPYIRQGPSTTGGGGYRGGYNASPVSTGQGQQQQPRTMPQNMPQNGDPNAPHRRTSSGGYRSNTGPGGAPQQQVQRWR